MPKASKRFDPYLIALVILAAIFVIYWTGFTIYKYRSFGDYFWDIGQDAYGMYLHIHYANLIYGMQFLAFSNHISPFKVLLLPLFALSQNPITLVFIQDTSLALAGIVAYFIGRDIAGSKYFGFALGLAFLINPGVRGIAYFDLHVEAFIPLFYLLSFYFFMRKRNGYFLISYAIMLSIIETSALVGISLLVALLVYVLLYESKGTDPTERKSKMKSIAIAFAITIIFILFYHYAVGSLLSMYNSGQYSNIPPSIKVLNFLSIQLTALKNLNAIQYNKYLLLDEIVVGFIILFLGFGLTNFRNIILTLILLSPWLLEMFIFHNVAFGGLTNHYYSYVVGGAIVAATLGFIIISKRKSKFLKMNTKQLLNFFSTIIICLSIMFSVAFLYALQVNTLLPSNWHANPNYSSIESLLQTIPSNTSVMAQPSISAHLYDVLYLETPPDYKLYLFTSTGYNVSNISTFYEKPQYVVFDAQLPDFNTYEKSTQFDVYKYISGNYTLWESSGALKIYKLSK